MSNHRVEAGVGGSSMLPEAIINDRGEMRVKYLTPACLGIGPQALRWQCLDLSTSCYLVEVCPGAGVEGKIIEGDVLMVDEDLPVQHGDLTVIETDDGLELFRSHRIGGAFRLLPMNGGEGMFARQVACRGVVVKKSLPLAN